MFINKQNKECVIHSHLHYITLHNFCDAYNNPPDAKFDSFSIDIISFYC